MPDSRRENRSRQDRPDPSDDSAIIRFFRFMRRMASFCLTCLMLTAIGGGLLLLYLRSQALPAVTVTQTSQIYDMHGKLIDSFHAGQNRQVVPLSDIAPSLIDATLSVEDRNFYHHLGIDPKGLARAVVTDIKTMSMEQGASTITQQLARNLYLNQDRTWSRKLKEAFYALHLEMRLSKDQILEQYLNQIYFGHSTYGVQAASQMFFGKDAKDLTLAESALLAGIPKGPKYYSPYLSMQNAKDRQKLVLQAMVDQGHITREQADAAAKEPLTILPLKKNEPSEAPYFQDYVRTYAVERLGIPEDLFDAGGLRITTTLDLRMQKIAEEAVAKQMTDDSELQAALIAIDPRNGYIKAMIGGKSYKENQFNRVFATTRQPGSSFKPIVYLTALENGATALTKYRSEPTVFSYDNGKQTYSPSNFANHYEMQDIDMRLAIAKSDNIYAVHTIMDVGADKVVEMARRMGITSPLKPLPSLALGTFPVSPFEMASAYGILANQGVRVEPIAIVRIEDSSGKLLYEAQPQETKVVEPAYTYVLTNLMQSVFEEGGTGFRVSDLMKRPVAGKTGTTNTDAWMVGYTPELATAVWVGYDKDYNLGTAESRKAAPIFAEFIEQALEAVPPKLFPIPEGVTNVYIDPASGKLANDACPGSRMEAFVAGTEPTEYCGKAKAGAAAQNRNKPKENSSWWQDLKRWWNE